MRRGRVTILILALVLLAPLPATPADAAEERLEPRPTSRNRGRAVLREPSRPGKVPPELQRVDPGGPRESSPNTAGLSSFQPFQADNRALRNVLEPQPPTPPQPNIQTVGWEQLAIAAGNWSAVEAIAREGAGEYFRMGTHIGIQEGLDDETVGRLDYALGEAEAMSDPEAEAAGEQIGRAAVGWLARDDAERRVVRQFSDLEREPRPFVSARPPYYSPEIPEVAEPGPRQLFEEFPMRDYLPASASQRGWLEGWQYNSAQLYDLHVWNQAYNAGWDDPLAAYDRWTATPYGAQYLSTLTDYDAQSFQDLFVAAFDAWLDMLYSELLLAAWDEGYEAGWSYGAFVHEEWQYRVGYAHGFAMAVRRAAEIGFDLAYEADYGVWYRRFFHEWATHPKLALEEVEMVDTSDDGLFEAGEAVSLRYAVVNYGGGDGTFPVSLSGSLLATAVHSELWLPRRSRTEPEPLDARLHPAAPEGIYDLVFAVDTSSRTVELQIRGATRLTRQASP